AVADDDRVGIGEAVDLRDESCRVNRRRVRLGHRLVARAGLRLGLPQLLEPGVPFRSSVRGRSQRRQRGFYVAEDRDLGRSVLAMAVDVDVDDLRVVGKDGWLAEVEAEVERHADDENEVGLTECLAACAREDRKSTRLNSSHVSISYAVFCL